MLAAIVESSEDAIISKSLAGIIQSWNSAAERMFGYSATEAIGRHISLIIPTDRLQEEDLIMARLRAGDRLEHFETIRRHRDGHLFPVSLTISPIRDDQGTVVGASKIARDISDKRDAENALREANRLKDRFLATLSHELRNPLAPIRAGVQLIQQQASTSGDPRLRETSAMIERQLRHLVLMLEDLLDVSRASTEKLELRRKPVLLASIVQSATEASIPLIHAANQAIDVQIPDEPLHLYADPTRLAQVLANLLNNASKYSPRGSRIDLRARVLDESLELTVKDRGVGIAADELPRVFEMFWQALDSDGRSRGGLGIGLALAQALVALHGGTLHAHSAGLGQGSEFTVKMPVLRPDETKTFVSTERPENGAKRRILIVDDVRDAANSLGQLLCALGHDVTISFSGIDGVLNASRWHPDVMLVDIGMPGMSGYEVCKLLRQQAAGQTIFMIAVTGFGQESDRVATREAGFNLHLVKPVDGEALSRLIGNLPVQSLPERSARSPLHASVSNESV